MRREIITVNNFYEDPDAVRNYALNEIKNNSYSPFIPEDRQTPGHKTPWKTSCFKEAKDCPFKSSEKLVNTLQEIVGEEIDLESWNASYPTNPKGTPTVDHDSLVEGCRSGKYSSKWNCCFHFKYYQGSKLGEGVHTHSSNDIWSNVGDHGWAGLIYLNPKAPMDSGLMIFKNKLGKDYRWMTPKEEWQLIDSFGALYNRLVLVRGDKPHVGADGFSDLPEHGRLFQTIFFRVKNNKPNTYNSIKVNL